MNKRLLYYLFLLFVIPVPVGAENASNVRVRQQNKDIIITYDLSKTSSVKVFIASDKIPEFTLLKAVEGAVGEKVQAGKDREIVWHPLAGNEEFVDNNVRFMVEATGLYEHYALRKSHRGVALGGKTNAETFVTFDLAYAFTSTMSYGLTLGRTFSGIGWYLGGRTDFHFKSPTDGLVCDKGGSINGEIPFYSGNRQVSAWMANAGMVFDFIDLGGGSPRNRFNTFGVYVGVGYGKYQVLWETTDGKWVEYGPSSVTGMNVNGGLLFSIYGLTVKTGVNAIGVKHLELEAGIGWMF